MVTIREITAKDAEQAWHLGSLLFDLINYWLPDAATDGIDGSAATLARTIRWSVSMLMVATPVWLYLTSFVAREAQREPVKRASTVRRWVGYLTLFVAASVLIGDATALVYNLLGGELTTRFILKALVVFVIAGGAFAYYRSELAADEKVAAS